jgi:hypothetical protein
MIYFMFRKSISFLNAISVASKQQHCAFSHSIRPGEELLSSSSHFVARV